MSLKRNLFLILGTAAAPDGRIRYRQKELPHPFDVRSLREIDGNAAGGISEIPKSTKSYKD